MAPLDRWIPLLSAVRGYRRDDARADLVAGLTTAVMLIPQGMAYALLAGLPPIVGLYASTLPLIAYALFGTSRQLAVGPVAMVSLLVAGGVGSIAQQGTPQYVAAALTLALLVGVLQFGMGLLRAGFLVNFLSHPVISGFTSAAAIIIGLSQLKHLLGVKLEAEESPLAVVAEAVARLGEVHATTLAIGVGAIAVLLGLRRIDKRIPAALVAVVGGTLLVWAGGLAERGVKIVGEVPEGLPSVALPTVDLPLVTALLPTALTIALVGFMESISVAKAFARKHRYELNANQELVGLGLANLVASVFQGYPITGGFSRTAVNDQAGARTGVAAIITAGFIMLTLLFLTPLFHSLPKAVLAAIIMVAVVGLIDTHEVVHLWKVKKSDLALLVLTFVATLTWGIEPGIFTGVGASLGWFVVKTTRPHTAVLGRVQGTEAYRNVLNFPDAETTPGVLAVRVDAQFYFGNVSFLKETLARLQREASAPVRAVVIDATSINDLDSSADAALHEIHEALRDEGIALFLAGVKGPVRAVFARSGFDRVVGDGRIHLRVHQAMLAAAEYVRTAASTATAAPGVASASRAGEAARATEGSTRGAAVPDLHAAAVTTS
jgi:SulP family sulfate permease